MTQEEAQIRGIVDTLDANLVNAYGSLYVLGEGLRSLLQIAGADGGAALVLAAERAPGILGAQEGLSDEAAQELFSILREALGTAGAPREIPQLSPWRDRVGYQDLLLLPFQTPEGIGGSVALLGRSALALTAEQRRWMDRAVKKMSSALERTRLMEALQAKVLEWNLLMKIGQEIVSRPDEQLLSRTVSLIADTFGFQQVAFLSPQGGDWKVEAVAGRSLCCWQAGDTVAVPDGLLPEPAEANKWEAAWANEVCGASGLVFGEVVVPVTLGDEGLGVLDVRSGEADAFTQRDSVVLKSVADQIAVALQNRRLLLEIEERNRKLVRAQARLVQAERLAAIGEISLAIKHEINNPMTAILGNAEWLLEEEQGLSDEGRRALTLVHQMALRVRDIVMRLENVADRKRPYLQSLEMTDLRDGKSP